MRVVGQHAQRQALQAAGSVSDLTGVKTVTFTIATLVGHDSGVSVSDFTIGIYGTFVQLNLDIMGFQITEVDQTLDGNRLIDVDIFWCGDIDGVDFEIAPMFEHLFFPVGEIFSGLIVVVGNDMIAIAGGEVADGSIIAEHPGGIKGGTIEPDGIFHLGDPFPG